MSFAFEGEAVPDKTDTGRKLRPIQIQAGLVAQPAADERIKLIAGGHSANRREGVEALLEREFEAAMPSLATDTS